MVGRVVVVRWRMSYEADLGLPGASSSPGLGPAGEFEEPREQAGAVPCRAQEPSSGPPTGQVRVLSQRWTSSPSPSLQHIGPSAWVTVCGTCYPPCTTVWAAWGVSGPVRSWVPGCLSDDSWAGSGVLALRELSLEICLLLVGPGLRGEPCPSWSEQRIALIW